PTVLYKLKIPNTGYPRLQRRRRDGHTGAAAGLDQDRAAAVAHQAQGFGAGRAGAPAVSADRRSAPGPVDRRGRGPGGLPLHGGVRLGASIQHLGLPHARAGAQPQGPAAHPQSRAIAGVSGRRLVQSARWAGGRGPAGASPTACARPIIASTARSSSWASMMSMPTASVGSFGAASESPT